MSTHVYVPLSRHPPSDVQPMNRIEQTQFVCVVLPNSLLEASILSTVLILMLQNLAMNENCSVPIANNGSSKVLIQST
jgi:hypothetical protein